MSNALDQVEYGQYQWLVRVSLYAQQFVFTQVAVGEGEELLFSVLGAEFADQLIGGFCR